MRWRISLPIFCLSLIVLWQWNSPARHFGLAQSPPPADFHWLHLTGPTQDRWLADLQSQNLEIVQYIPPNSYVVWGQLNPNQRSLSQLSFIKEVTPFNTSYRWEESLAHRTATTQSLRLLLYRGADTQSLQQQLTALGGKITALNHSDPTFQRVYLSLPTSALETVITWPGVYSLKAQPTDGGLRGELSTQINAAPFSHTQNLPPYRNWLSARQVSGAGVVVASVDAGLDETHPDLRHRMVNCVGSTCGGTAVSGHGTHTAGLIAGDGRSNQQDLNGQLRGLGVAPEANLLEQNYDIGLTLPDGLALLLQESTQNGAIISNNSWGTASTPQGYDEDTRLLDWAIRDADPTTPGNQSLSYVLALMNGGGGTSTQGAPDEAKNALTVGASQLQGSRGGWLTEVNNLAPISAHGPALDGRIIPHLVAPGCYVDSTWTGHQHTLACGTSMAAPQVSGAAALFVEHYRTLYQKDPSPALIKAALLAVAHPLLNHADADSLPITSRYNPQQGWGRLNLNDVISPTQAVIYVDQNHIFDESGQLWQRPIRAVDPSQPVRLMLVWTDAPGHGLGGSLGAWNNDLNLEVTLGESNQARFYGNVFEPNSPWSSRGGQPDPRNNTEGVFLPAEMMALTPQFTITVRAANINSDALPNQGDSTDQDFALVCYNCAFQTDFTVQTSPNPQSVCAQNHTEFALNIGQSSVEPTLVKLSLTGLPNGITASFQPEAVVASQPPATSTLRLNNLTALPADWYRLYVGGQAAGRHISHSVQLHLSWQSLAPPTLYQPAANQPQQSLTPAFRWANLGPDVSYTLEIATDYHFQRLVQQISNLRQASYTLSTPLASNQTYYWRVQASNACGPSPFSPAEHFATAGPNNTCGLGTEAATLFYEDFEAGSGSWQSVGWPETWQISQTRAHRGQWAYHAPSPATISDQYLFSPLLTLPTADRSPQLSFWQYQSLENGVNTCFDGGLLEISTDGGQNWQNMATALHQIPYDGPVSGEHGNPMAGQLAWCGDPRLWTETRLDLAEWAGQTAQFRFRLASDDSREREGWFVDDVSLQTCQPTGLPAIRLSQSVQAGRDNEACGSARAVTVRPGEGVTHCYQLENTGALTLTQHYLQDNLHGHWRLGQVLSGTFMPGDGYLILPPGESLTVSRTLHLTQSGQVVSRGYYTASQMGANAVSGVDVATITVISPSVVLTASLGRADGPGCSGPSELVISGAAVRFCFELVNTSPLTLNVALWQDSLWGTLAEGGGTLGTGELGQVLPPGEHITLTFERMMTETGTINAYNELRLQDAYGNQVEAHAQTRLTVLAPPSVQVSHHLNLADRDAACTGSSEIELGPGTAVRHCYRLENTGGLTFTRLTLETGWGRGAVINLSLRPGAHYTHSFVLTHFESSTVEGQWLAEGAGYGVLAGGQEVVRVLDYAVSLGVGQPLLSGVSGRVVSQTVWVTNTGQMSDDYVLLLTDSAWAASFEPQSVRVRPVTQAKISSLGPGEGARQQIFVAIPAVATERAAAETLVRVESERVRSVAAAQAFTTTATRLLPPNSAYVTLDMVAMAASSPCPARLDEAETAWPFVLEPISNTARVRFCQYVQNAGNVTFTVHLLENSYSGLSQTWLKEQVGVTQSVALTLPPWSLGVVSDTLTLRESVTRTLRWTAKTEAGAGQAVAQADMAVVLVGVSAWRGMYLPLVWR